MNRSFLPWLRAQNQQRGEIDRLARQITELEEQLQIERIRHTDAVRRLIDANDALTSDITTLRGQVSDRDEALLVKDKEIAQLQADLKAAKYHGKKKPTTTEIVTPAQS